MKSNLKKIVPVVFLIGIIYNGFSQNSYNDLIKEYDNICFCSVGITHPKSILKLDNNLEILFALKNGYTLGELDSLSINYTKSQIALLKISNLIEKKDLKYYSNVPILEKERTIQLRNQTKLIAKNIIPEFEQEYNIFIKTLDNKGLQKNAFTLFFAYVLDDIVWTILEEKGIIRETQITENKPFWDGVMWMIEPKRDFACGTNSMNYNNTMISVNWSDNSKISVSSYETLKKMLVDYEKKGEISDKEVIETFSKNELFDKNGKLLIPIITADKSDIIFNQSKNIAEIIAEYLDTKIDYTQILANYSIKDKNQAVVILYHEIMWDILDIMEREKLLKKPKAFEKPSQAKPSDLKDLIFIVKK